MNSEKGTLSLKEIKKSHVHGKRVTWKSHVTWKDSTQMWRPEDNPAVILRNMATSSEMGSLTLLEIPTWVRLALWSLLAWSAPQHGKKQVWCC